ncbi:hypothetical protein GCM10009760_41170 [Kitasatospora kazusensis]|uniref:Uncharacterized protein n=1 Tax=Kitasatospora kazusensis TaxID=407974 RepID=A0ABP5LK13_9ACTN
MAHGAQSVPFAFVAEAARHRSNISPPDREPRSAKAVCGGLLIALLVMAGLATAVALGTPALQPPTA